jgi:hypothetical protein
MKEKYKKYIGNKAFYMMVMAIAVPIMIQNGLTNFVNLLDNIMVGRLGTEEMSGVSIVNQIIFVYNLCIFGGTAGSADEGGSCGCGGQSYFQLSADIRKVRIPPAGGGGSGCGNGAFALYGNGDRRNMGAYP